MKNKSKINRILNYLIAMIWLVNGLFCKVINSVPRHEQIVAKILGNDLARPITFTIGCLEIIMAIWIISRYQSRVNALIQISIIGTMNVLEFILAPELLLWGRVNALFALILIITIYYNEFILNKPKTSS